MSATDNRFGRFGVSPILLWIMVAGGAGIVAVAIAANAGWIRMEDPENRIALYFVAAFGLFSMIFGAAMSISKIDWDPAGLRVQMLSFLGVSRRIYRWQDLRMVTLKNHHWRIDCSDGRFFRIATMNMIGGAPLLQEMARRGIPSDHDILQALASEEKF